MWRIEWLIDDCWQPWTHPNSGRAYNEYESQNDAESALPVVLCCRPLNRAAAVRTVAPTGEVTRVYHAEEPDAQRLSDWVVH